MPKNIIICCDGTNNEFGKTNTNVVRFYQCLDRSPEKRQAAFYDPGVGTIESPGVMTKAGRFFSRAVAGATGRGISENVRDVFRFLMVHWEPGDRIYMFGFSRGAYTVRMAAGMLHKCGLPAHGNETLLPYATRIYKMERGDSSVSREFRKTFGTPCPVHFLGLWDTVSSVGVMINPKSYDFTAHNEDVTHIRHVMAVDERRGFFRTNRWEEKPAAPRSLVQAWFPGVHSDVGGGYADGELWKHPFQWIVNEAKIAKLEFNQTELDTLLGPQPAPWHTTKQHDSATLAWKLAGIIPKRRTRRNAAGEYTGQYYGFAFPRPRKLLPGEMVHRSVLERWRDVPAYRPPNLNQDTITAMLARLQPGDGFLPYQT